MDFKFQIVYRRKGSERIITEQDAKVPSTDLIAELQEMIDKAAREEIKFESAIIAPADPVVNKLNEPGK